MSPVTVLFKRFIYESYDCTHKQLHMYMCGKLNCYIHIYIYKYILNSNQNTEYEHDLHSSLGWQIRLFHHIETTTQGNSIPQFIKPTLLLIHSTAPAAVSYMAKSLAAENPLTCPYHHQKTIFKSILIPRIWAEDMVHLWPLCGCYVNITGINK